MKTSDLSTKIKENGITPFVLYDEAESDDSLRVNSELDEYLSNLKTIGVITVLVKTKKLSQEDFEKEIQVESGDEESEENRIIDISSIISDLESYKRFIGADAFQTIECVISGQITSYEVKEEWWERFKELRETAYEKIGEDQEQALEMEITRQEEEEKQAEEKEKRLLESLDEFLKDEEFISLPTQRAMMSYVMDKVPELETLPVKGVRSKIQRLHGRIDAKRKRRN
jgi:ribosomal protein L25 (general stress protein Ctc)